MRIAVATGSRADFGLLRELLRLLRGEPAVRLQLIVCGQHLVPEFGSTWKDVEADGFTIDARVDLQLSADTPAAVAAGTGHGMIGFAAALDRLGPDILVVLGDRYEIFAAASAASIMNIPIAHIHGGEVTQGAFDDALRHAMTKMASLHFVAAEPYRRRVIQMGEQPDRVYNVGAPGLDQIAAMEEPDRAKLCATLGIDAKCDFVLATLHPTTRLPHLDIPTVNAMLTALDRLQDHNIVFTGVNADPGNKNISSAINLFVSRNPDRAVVFDSIGSKKYLAAMKLAALVIGNSSSGIVEAPALDTPCVNIGERQKGRLRAASIIDCEPTASAVSAAIRKALDPGFLDAAGNTPPPYGSGGASARIVEILKSAEPDELKAKVFRDAGFNA